MNLFHFVLVIIYDSGDGWPVYQRKLLLVASITLNSSLQFWFILHQTTIFIVFFIWWFMVRVTYRRLPLAFVYSSIPHCFNRMLLIRSIRNNLNVNHLTIKHLHPIYSAQKEFLSIDCNSSILRRVLNINFVQIICMYIVLCINNMCNLIKYPFSQKHNSIKSAQKSLRFEMIIQ